MPILQPGHTIDPRLEQLQKFQSEDGHENAPGYDHYLQRLFRDVDLQGKRVLEIGSGRGLMSLSCALAGAQHVVSIEPEMEGSTSGVIATQERRIAALGLTNIDLRRADFNQTSLDGEQFDVIVLIAVLNHLYETPLNAATERDAFDAYVRIAKKMHKLLAPGGVVVATDACRYCFWTQARRIGLPKSLCLTQRTINWKIHQQPAVWTRIFREAGFHRCSVSYPVPYRLRKLERAFQNAAANFFCMGEFILHAKKASLDSRP